MDTSEKYIEMCRKADEIQTHKPSAESSKDYFFCTVHKQLLGYNSELGYQWCGNWRNWHNGDDDCVIWLPRQDQLQAMIKTSYNDAWDTIQQFVSKTCSNSRKNSPIMCASMEQLWLAYVMAEKYDKRWDGEKWVPVDDIPLGAYPLISKIMAAKDRFLSDNHIPRYLHLNEKTWRNLLKEITPSIVDTKQCGWAEYVSVYGLQVRIDSDVPDNEIMVYGRYK